MLVDAVPADVSVPTLQRVVYGGAPMTVAATSRALERFGPIFVQLYGQGETPMTATVLRSVPDGTGSSSCLVMMPAFSPAISAMVSPR